MKKNLNKKSAEVNQITSNLRQTKIAQKDQSVQATRNCENKETQKNPTEILNYEKCKTPKNDRFISIQTAETKKYYSSTFSRTNFLTVSNRKFEQTSQNVNLFRRPTAKNYNPNKF
jgi:hypothetical protein